LAQIDVEAAGRKLEGTVPVLPVSKIELVIGLLALLMWFVLFAGGILIATEPYRQAIASPTSLGSVSLSSVMVLAFWTITNVGVLCCLSAFLGAFGRRTRFALQLNAKSAEKYLDSVPRQLSSHYVSAIMRGFGIYGMVMAGLLVLASESLEKPSQGGYLRLSATVCVMAFYVGYDPELFASVLQKVRKLIISDAGDAADPDTNRSEAKNASK
jgi:hypothetical protein